MEKYDFFIILSSIVTKKDATIKRTKIRNLSVTNNLAKI